MDDQFFFKFKRLEFGLILTFALRCVLMLIQIDISVSYGEPCSMNLILQCKENESCSRISSNDTLNGVCKCLPDFIEFPGNKSCIVHNPDPLPHEHSYGVAIGISVSVLLLTAAVFIGLLQYRYKILNGMLHSIYRIRRRGERGQQGYEVADNGDDVDPIV